MRNRFHFGSWLCALLVVFGCVDKVDLSIPANELPIVVDGMITDEPGPDTVKLFRGYPADGGYHPPKGITGAIVVVTEDTGLVDTLTELGYGEYMTNLIDGSVGRSYQLSVLVGTTLATSSQQRLVAAGSIDTIFYEFTSRVNTATGLSEDGFDIFINSSLSANSSRRMKWTFFGTYTVMTDPAALQFPIPPCLGPGCPTTTLPCAENCECCVCWYTTFEKAPIISTPTVLGGSQLDRVFIQYIPINAQTFFDRYRVEISQMELSEDVFEFYKAIKRQSDNANSIFQPPFFEVEGNVKVVSGPEKIFGSFSASAVVRRHIYILQNELPYDLTIQLLPGDCRAVADNSTLTMPPYWGD